MEITRELLDAFFEHRCTPTEAKAIANFLRNNPQEAQRYLPEAEWKEAVDYTLMPEGFWEEQWQLMEEKRKGKQGRVSLVRVAVAASVLIVISGLVWFYLSSIETGRNPLSQHQYADEKTVSNNNDEPMEIRLGDSSTVVLQPGTVIRYKEKFEENRRDIVLERGDALFTVSKDKERPFTVYSGSISTKALGTKFFVSYHGEDAIASVHLLEGQVMVSSSKAKNKKESLLLPGDQLSYLNQIVEISRKKDKAADAFAKNDVRVDLGNSKSSDDKAVTAPAVRRKLKESGTDIPLWYRFEKEPLADVFKEIAAFYNLRIEYDRKALANKYFIGRFEQKDSIDKILQIIAELNHLQIEKVSDSYYKIK